MEINTKQNKNLNIKNNNKYSNTIIEKQKIINYASYFQQDKNKDFNIDNEINKNKNIPEEFSKEKNSEYYKHARTIGNKYQITVNGKLNFCKLSISKFFSEIILLFI